MRKNIKEMDYSEFVSLIRERNRPSGGIRTVHNVAVNSFLNSDKKMLEVGSNTGFTCVNMSLLTGCESVGVDINDESTKEAKRYSKEQGTEDKTSFLTSNAENLPFDDESFDVVWCSNVTSFIKNKEKAIGEYLRVLKTGGTLVVIPIYYKINPPQEIITKISKAIGTEVGIWDKSFWIDKFEKVGNDYKMPIELYYSKDYTYKDRKKFIEEYSKIVCNKNHLNNLGEDIKTEVIDRLRYFMNLFNENLKYAGFTIFLYQKRKIKEEVELFLTKEDGN